MNIIDSSKSLLENIYFISGPILAILGLLIFYQIKIAKHTVNLMEKQVNEAKKHLKIISKRDAALLATKQIEVFIEKLIPLENELIDKMKSIDYPVFKDKIKNFTLGEFVEWDKDYLKEFTNKIEKLEFMDLSLINSLEGFATYFTKGIADEEIAFSSIGNSYTYVIERLYPQISIYGDNKNYKNLIELYWIWKNRLEKSELEVQLQKKQELIKEELKQFESKLDDVNKKSKVIKPIGDD
jgi:hypothetical protein